MSYAKNYVTLSNYVIPKQFGALDFGFDLLCLLLVYRLAVQFTLLTLSFSDLSLQPRIEHVNVGIFSSQNENKTCAADL